MSPDHLAASYRSAITSDWAQAERVAELESYISRLTSCLVLQASTPTPPKIDCTHKNLACSCSSNKVPSFSVSGGGGGGRVHSLSFQVIPAQLLKSFVAVFGVVFFFCVCGGGGFLCVLICYLCCFLFCWGQFC